jgi:transcriptional regulator with XRE-family HTH domain
MEVITDKDELANLAANLRLELHDRGWKQFDLAQASGVPHYTVSRILHSKCDPSLSAVSRLAKALRTKIDVLISPPPRRKLRDAS